MDDSYEEACRADPDSIGAGAARRANIPLNRAGPVEDLRLGYFSQPPWDVCQFILTVELEEPFSGRCSLSAVIRPVMAG